MKDRVRDKRGHEFVGFVYLAVFVFVLRWMHEYGLSQGLPRVSPIVTIAIWIGPLADIAIHELGHALMAWAVGFRVRILSIGPLLVWRDRNGNRSYRFDWSRFLVGGYMGAVPASQRGVRPKFLLILLAGPFAALGASVLLFWILLKVPGTSWEGYWGIIATCSAWSFADFVANLIPVGNTDGSILLNVLLWTSKGQDHIAKLHGSKEYEQAEDRQGELDFDSEVATRERLLQQALQRRNSNPGELAVHYHKLGGALMRVSRYAEAEEALKKGLETLDQSDEVDTAAQANGWLVLHQIYLVRKRAADMDRAYHKAVGPLERLLAKRSSGAEEAQNRKCLATLHRASGRYEAALREIKRAREIVPESPATLLLRAGLLREQAECEFRLGKPDAGLETANAAAGMLRSPQIAEGERSRAWADLALLGTVLWQAGHDEEAIRFKNEASEQLDLRGAKDAAARFRLVTATILRRSEQFAEAEAALPNAEGLNRQRRTTLLRSRGAIRLRSGRVEEAVADLREALAMVQSNPHASVSSIAETENFLAQALVKMGQVEEAEALARAAYERLQREEHPQASEPLATLALIARERGDSSWRTLLEQAKRTMSEALLMSPPDKARFFEETAKRVDEVGASDDAAGLWTAARAEWEKLGIGSSGTDQRQEPGAAVENGQGTAFSIR